MPLDEMESIDESKTTEEKESLLEECMIASNCFLLILVIVAFVALWVSGMVVLPLRCWKPQVLLHLCFFYFIFFLFVFVRFCEEKIKICFPCVLLLCFPGEISFFHVSCKNKHVVCVCMGKNKQRNKTSHSILEP